MKEILWHVAWVVIAIITAILWCVCRPFVLFSRWRKERKPRYGYTYKSFEQAILVLELEDMDRSAWNLEPSGRVVRHCPHCKLFHDGKNYCSLKCEIGGRLCGFLKKAIGK